MKRKNLIAAMAIVLICGASFQSCIGSFSLTNKVLTWNKGVSTKFLNEVVFFAFWILPVYEVTAVADLLVLNSIEFWSGNKPVEVEDQTIFSMENGDYKINSHDKGYTVTNPDGSIVYFDYDSDTQTWSFSKNEGERTDFLRFKDDSHVEILNADGKFVDVELTRDGVDKFKFGAYEYMMAAR